jgi:predicted nucleic acid-binding protein
MAEKVLIFDSGALISFSMNGITDYIRKLREVFKGKFLVTSEIKKEIVDKPITIKRFQLEALKLKQLLDDKVLELPSSLGINDSQITSKMNEILSISNNTFQGTKKNIHILDSGEASCLALSKILDEKKIKNVLVIDERTTRLLVEKPENLLRIFERKMNIKITSKQQNYKFFSGFKIIRSAELVYVAYKKGLTKLKNKNVLDALLYAVKFKGAAISRDEIEEIKRIG